MVTASSIKRHFLGPFVAIVAFFVGTLTLTVPNFVGLASVPEVAIDIDHPVSVSPTDHFEELAFYSVSVACGSDGSGNRASLTNYEATDGTRLVTSLIYNFPSRSSAKKKYQSLIKGASKIIDQTPRMDFHGKKIADRVVFEKDDEFFLLTLPDEKTDRYFITLIACPTLRHILEFEKQKRSLANSAYLNQLN